MKDSGNDAGYQRSIREATRNAKNLCLQALGLKNKGRLEFGCDADFVIVDDDIDVQSTWIAGEMVYTRREE